MAFVSAADYCFLQLTNGERAQISQTDYYTCTHTLCQVCAYTSTHWYAGWNKCQTTQGVKICTGGSNGNGNPGGNVENLTLTVTFPFSDGAVLTKQTYAFNIRTNKIAAITLIDNVRKTQLNLCPNCMSYNKPLNFKQGFNNYTIRAVKGTEVLYKYISFFVDNKRPVITKVTPEQNKYVSSVFSVTYNEENIKQLVIYYGSSTSASSAKSMNLTNCSGGMGKTCSVIPDLTGYEGKQIYYWFVLKDVANNIVQSKSTRVIVDNTAPVINSVSAVPERVGGYVKLSVNMVEKNLDKVYYYDNGDIKGKVLCVILKNGLCSNRLSFRAGGHNLRIVAYDKAGNSAETTTSFRVGA